MGRSSFAPPTTNEQATIACEAAGIALMLTAAQEKLTRCIAALGDHQSPSAMHAQQIMQHREEREQLRSAAAKLRRANEILTLISTGNVTVQTVEPERSSAPP